MQIDLIDMGHRPDGIYKWIAHYMDHWSKYHILFPMAHKSAVEVAHGLKTRMLAYFGVPRVLQSDCGREFNNHFITTIVMSGQVRQRLYMEGHDILSSKAWWRGETGQLRQS